MFGILRPHRGLLEHSERVRHTSAYCNLCGLLSGRYGVRSRMLVVHDIATLWWLLGGQANSHAQPLAIGNCLRGGARHLRNTGLSEVQRLVAALSVYTLGVKVADDLVDGGGWRARAANRMYGHIFEAARQELADVNFNLGELEDILSRQQAMERAGERDFVAAAEPTAEAYGLVARAIAAACGSSFTGDQAQRVGEGLGRSVYLADSVRDYADDLGKSYNPLCLSLAHAPAELPQAMREQVLSYIGAQLTHGRQIATSVAEPLLTSWHAIERALLAASGVHDRKSVTLYLGCCVPCGDGAVYVDERDCDPCKSSCACTCLLVCCVCTKACSGG